jgi:hypothetical protein
VLARIQDFLPRLKAENDSLAQRIRDDPSSVDIENIEEDTEQYIEMASSPFFQNQMKSSLSSTEPRAGRVRNPSQALTLQFQFR